MCIRDRSRAASLVALLTLSACQAPGGWQRGGLEPLPAPRSLRPCCAFGHRLGLSLLGVPVPIRVDNVIGLADLGPHRYDGGLVFVNGTIEQGLVSLKSDGMAYTCRGGFVDTAHVRDYADWTFFFWTQLERTLE